MQGSLLVDSSFFISRLGRELDPLTELAEAAGKWEIITRRVVMVEVCRDLENEKALDCFIRAFSMMIMITTTAKLWHKAMDLAWRMDRQGKIMQVTGLVIAPCALEVDATVMTLDSDFLHVPDLTGISRNPLFINECYLDEQTSQR